MSNGGISTAGDPIRYAQTRYDPARYDSKRPEPNADSEDLAEEVDFQNAVLNYKKKIYEKIKSGNTETSYQIGSQSLTEKEWDELLEKFDLAVAAFDKNTREKIAKRNETQKDAEDILQELQKAGIIREAQKEETAVSESQKTETAVSESQKTETAVSGSQKTETAVSGSQKAEDISDMQIDMLFSDTVQARFPLQELDEEGNPKADVYLIAIDKNGIRCSKAGSSEYEWQIIFTDESQYQKAVEFMDWADDHMDNFLFSAHDNFWEDYLNGNMDVSAFQKFLEGTNNGIPDYPYTVGDSMYVDREKVQWAKYMNPLHFFTELSPEDLMKSVEAEMEQNKELYGKTFEQLLKDAYIGWETMDFGFAGESGVYSFYEFVKEWERRYPMEAV